MHRPKPEPLDADGIWVIAGGTVVWFVLFLVLVPFHGDHELWLWTSLAGWLLGMLGTYLTWRHRQAVRAARSVPEGVVQLGDQPALGPGADQ